ncbi:MAG TPA: LPS export ABC transporter permease LptF [Erwinia persicina]|uniref:LPS export ABC transporter permease LptF n=1 Tax=Erwinia persicina TaxID=55211 RepID=UPI0007893B8B|nr:LPS export ABC transporter permease LptF [Erwinia persicina]AXU97855.1 LPS export ABC transporter permease LptF [Erwinia persicina]MBD8166009.1 LPS export ABC transporter permease LptF [Erwinia persicina]MCQ4092647.1 LPS export ABC transporter permease LptF [Erwinia persicina]MCQ4100747.1 LPS export ABC transporter permease LptF [Erwinia persicina]MCQ4104099.1 LPS export ABC transporter permease LptF [Erwinia persicina]
MLLIERYILMQTHRLVATLLGFLIFIFASYSAQRYLTDAANGTLALTVVFDIVFYKVVIALEMLLPVGLYVAVGVTLGQLYSDAEITAMFASGVSPLRLYKAAMLLAVPLGLMVMLLSMYARPWAYGQIYQLEQQSQSELDTQRLVARRFNVNDSGRMVLAARIDPITHILSDVLIYTSSGMKSSVYRARTVSVTDPSPASPSVLLQSGTSYTLDHQGSEDSETIYRHLNLQLAPMPQSNNTRRKSASLTALAGSQDPADQAERQWRQSRGVSAVLMALLAVSLSRIKPRQGRFTTLLPLTAVFTAIFYGGNLSRTLVANGALPLIPGVWCVPLVMLAGVVLLIARDLALLPARFR